MFLFLYHHRTDTKITRLVKTTDMYLREKRDLNNLRWKSKFLWARRDPCDQQLSGVIKYLFCIRNSPRFVWNMDSISSNRCFSINIFEKSINNILKMLFPYLIFLFAINLFWLNFTIFKFDSDKGHILDIAQTPNTWVIEVQVVITMDILTIEYLNGSKLYESSTNALSKRSIWTIEGNNQHIFDIRYSTHTQCESTCFNIRTNCKLYIANWKL